MSNRGYPLYERWEDAIIERDYTAHGWKHVQRQMPHRSKGSITTRANYLGIRGTKIRQRRKPLPVQETHVWNWPKPEVAAWQLVRAWRGPVNHESPLAWRVRA